jgi:hypothetical protein
MSVLRISASKAVRFAIYARLAPALLLGAAVALSGCDDDDATAAAMVTLTGTAATGAAFQGTVTATDSAGATYGPVTIDTNGEYEITVNSEPPFILQATSSTGGETLYSYAGSGQLVANITELTTLAVYEAVEASGVSLEDLYAQWESQDVTPAEIEVAVQAVCDSLTLYLEDAGVPTQDCAILTGEFVPDGTGIDYVLDQITVAVDGNSVTATGPYGGEIAIVAGGGAVMVDIPEGSVWTLAIEYQVGDGATQAIPTDGLDAYLTAPVLSESSLTVLFAQTDISASTANAELNATYTLDTVGDLSETGDQLVGEVTGNFEITGPQDQTISQSFRVRYVWTRTG